MSSRGGGGGGAPPPQQGNGSESHDFLWLIVGVVLAVAIAWYFWQQQISAFILSLRYYEIVAVKFVIQGWNSVAHFLHIPAVSLNLLDQWQSYIISKPGGVEFQTLIDASNAVGLYLRYPVALIFVALGLFTYQRHISAKFNRKLTMEQLRKLEQENWPQITPIIKLNLLEQDIDEGPWAMSLTPLQFCKKYDLIEEEREEGQKVAKLKKGAAHRVFALQLGNAWHSLEALPEHIRVLFAIFAARTNHDVEPANDLLRQIAASSASSGKLDFSGYQQLLAKYCQTRPIARVVSRHAYVYTVMASMLELARTDGVLASAEFLWLKPLDRRLWYVLNSVGRQTAVCEVAGVFAHWKAEREMKRPLKVPMVDEAVNALDVALQDLIYDPDEEQQEHGVNRRVIEG